MNVYTFSLSKIKIKCYYFRIKTNRKTNKKDYFFFCVGFQHFCGIKSSEFPDQIHEKSEGEAAAVLASPLSNTDWSCSWHMNFPVFHHKRHFILNSLILRFLAICLIILVPVCDSVCLPHCRPYALRQRALVTPRLKNSRMVESQLQPSSYSLICLASFSKWGIVWTQEFVEIPH